MRFGIRAFPQGSYRFEVVAVDAATGKVSPIETLSFRIVPPWWWTKTFMAAVVACPTAFRGLGSGAGVWALLLTQRRELERLVNERTEELDQKLAQEESLKAEAEQANQRKK